MTTMRDVDHAAFLSGGLVEPVALGAEEERRWIDCELGSLAEHRLDDHADPLTLDPERRARWESLATDEPSPSLEQRSYQTHYWLLEAGRRVGTIALSHGVYGGHDLRVASFYVFRSERGRGTGRRALDRLRELVAAQKRGLRLDTCWAWQRTVRFYLRAGLSVHMWKHDLTLRWDARCPPAVLDVGADAATLSVDVDGRPLVLATARRNGDALLLDEPSRELLNDARLGETAWDAVPTLSLAIALEGWPLIRSRESWERSRGSDGGPPESLAAKIAIWEAWDRHHHWRVETPKIPGLEYPSWEEFNRRWDEAIMASKATPID